ncbi:MAG TPA: SRPBCC family protein [Acidobacteriaceae bacterium]|nr:SRPBCC family protein [Acidobacteriaceae bacterium]
MSVSHPRFSARIAGPPDKIFGLIADLPNYHRWLPGSGSFGGTTDVSPYPVCLGTTYLDAGPAGARPGIVTEFDPPHRIAFHHTMQLRKGLLRADIDVQIRYALDPNERGTLVLRDLDLSIRMPGPLAIAEPLVLRAFRKENIRILAELKRYIEMQSAA